MKIHVEENTCVIYNGLEKEEVVSRHVYTSYTIFAEEGKVLKNKVTGDVLGTSHGLSSKEKIEDFEEIDPC